MAANAAASAASAAASAASAASAPPSLARQMNAEAARPEIRPKDLNNSSIVTEPMSMIELEHLYVWGMFLLRERMESAGLPVREIMDALSEMYRDTPHGAMAGHAVAYAAMDAIRDGRTKSTRSDYTADLSNLQGQRCLDKVRAFEVFIIHTENPYSKPMETNWFLRYMRGSPDLVEIASAKYYYPSENYWVFKSNLPELADEPPLIVTVVQQRRREDTVFSLLKSIDFYFARCIYTGTKTLALSEKVVRHIEKRKIGACESYTCDINKFLWDARLYADFRELGFRGFPRVIETKMVCVGGSEDVPKGYENMCVSPRGSTVPDNALPGADAIIGLGYRPKHCVNIGELSNDGKVTAWTYWRFELEK